MPVLEDQLPLTDEPVTGQLPLTLFGEDRPPRDVIGPMPGLEPGEPFLKGPTIGPLGVRERLGQLPIVGGFFNPYTELTQGEIQRITSGASRDVPTTTLEALQQGAEATVLPLAKPSQIGLMAATGATGELAPVLNRAIAGYFGATAAREVYRKLPMLTDPNLSQEKKLKALVEIVGEGAVTYLAGKSAVEAGPGRIKAPFEQPGARETALAPDAITAGGLTVGGMERLPLPTEGAPAPTGMLAPPPQLDRTQEAPALTGMLQIPQLQLPKDPSIAERTLGLPPGVTPQTAVPSRMQNMAPSPRENMLVSRMERVGQQLGELAQMRSLKSKETPGPDPSRDKGGMQMPKFNIFGMKVSKPLGGEAGYGLNPFVDNSPRPFKDLSTKDLQDLLEQGKAALANMEKLISDAGITAEDRQHPIWAKSASNKALEDVKYTMDYIQAELLKRKKQGPGNVGMGSQSGIAAAPGFPSDDELQRLRATPVPDLQAQHETLSQGIANFKAGRFPAGFRPEDAQRWIQNWTASARVIKQILDEVKQVNDLRTEIARKKLVERAVRPTLPVSDPIGNPTLENITGLSPEAHFEVVNTWIDRVMDRLDREGMTQAQIFQAQAQARATALRENAQKAANAHPNVENWGNALEKTQADLDQVRAEVAANPATQSARAMEIVSLAERVDFLGYGLNHVRQINAVRDAIGPALHDAPGTKAIMDKYGPFLPIHKAINLLDGVRFQRVAKQYLRSIRARGTVEEVAEVLKDMADAARLNRPIIAEQNRDPSYMNDAKIAQLMGGDPTPITPHPVADQLTNPVYLMNDQQYETFIKSPTAIANALARGHDGVIVDKPNGDVIKAMRFPQQLPPEGGGTTPPAQPPTTPPAAPTGGGTAVPIKVKGGVKLEGPLAEQKPPPAGPGEAPQSTVPPPVTGEGSAQVGGAEPPPTPPAISKPTTPSPDPSSGRTTGETGGFVPPLEVLLEKAPTALKQLNYKRQQFATWWKTRPNIKTMAQLLDAADTEAVVVGRQKANRLRIEKNMAKRRAAYVMIEASDPTLGAATVGGPRLNEDRLAEFRQIAHDSGDEDIIAAVDYAFKNRNKPRFNEYVQKARALLDEQNASEAANGIKPKDNQAYMPQFFDAPLKLGANESVMVTRRRGVPGEKFQNIFEAMKAGYKPQTIDIADVVEHRIRQGEMLLNQRTWADQLGNLIDPTDKKPVAMRPDKNNPVQEGYANMELFPGIRMAVHPNYQGIFKGLTTESQIRNNYLGTLAVGGTALIKHGTLAFDTFHLFRMLSREAMLHPRYGLPGLSGFGEVLGVRDTKGAGWRKGHSLLEWSAEDARQAYRRGEISLDEKQFADENREAAQLLIKNGLNVGRISENFYNENRSAFGKTWEQKGLPRLNRFIFQKVTRGAMMESALIELDRISKGTGKPPEEVARQVARDINVYYGNIQRQGFLKSKSFQDAAQVVFLAPQWVESMGRSEARAVLDPIPHGKPVLGTLTKGMGTALLYYYIGAQILNYATRKHLMVDNPEPDRQLDAYIPGPEGRGLFLPFDAVTAEIASEMRRFSAQRGGGVEGVTSAALRIVNNKLSPLARAVKIAASGRDYDSRQLQGVDRFKAAALAMIPVPIPLSPVRSGLEEKVGARPLTGINTMLQVERQLLAAVGLKTEFEPTKVVQAYQLIRNWKQHNEDPKIYQKWVRDEQSRYPQSEYAKLRNALARGDYDLARETFKGLGKSQEEVEKALSPFSGTEIYPGLYYRQARGPRLDKAGNLHRPVEEAIEHFKPLANLTDEQEEKFYNSLSEQDKKTYQDAKNERLLLYQRFYEAMDPKNKQPSAEALKRAGALQ